MRLPALLLQDVARATPTIDRTAVLIAAFGFAGLIVTSVLTLVLQRSAANDQRAARDEQRADARELREAAAKQVMKVEEIHTLVNNKSDVQAGLIKEAKSENVRLNEESKQEIARLNAALLAKAEASPAVVKPNPNEET